MTREEAEMTPARRAELLSLTPTGREIVGSQLDAGMVKAVGEEDVESKLPQFADITARAILDELLALGVNKLEGKARDFMVRLEAKKGHRPAGDLRGRLFKAIIERMKRDNELGKYEAKYGGRKVETANRDQVREVVLAELKKLWRENPPAPEAALVEIFNETK